MNTNRIFLGVCVALVAAAGTMYFHAARLRVAAEQAAVALAGEQRQRQADIRGAEERASAAAEAKTEAHRALGELKAAAKSVVAKPKPSAASPAGGTSAAARSAITPREAMANDPQLQTLWLEATRAGVARDYGRLFAALKLTPAQTERFAANMVKREEARMDLDAVAQTQGPDGSAAVQTLRKKADDEFKAAQLELLGEDGVREWAAYDRMAGVRRTVDGLAGALTLEGAPLTASQAEQLTRVFVAAVPALQNNARLNPGAIDWDAVETAVQPVLTPRQMAIFHTGGVIGGMSRPQMQLDAAIDRALKAERAATVPAAAKKEG